MITDRSVVYFTARIRSVAENARDLSILISKFQNEWNNINVVLPPDEEIDEKRTDYVSNITSTDLNDFLNVLNTLNSDIQNDITKIEKLCVRSPLSLE